MSRSPIDLATPGAATDPRDAGGKAANLARLLAAGLPVPPAKVVFADTALTAEVLADLGELGPSLAVRSSSPAEDRGAAGMAPGLFDSFTDVAPGDLERRIDEVRGGARSAAARAWSAATGHALPDDMAVVVQRYLAPEIAGTLYSRAPGDPGAMLIESATGERLRLGRAGVAAPGAGLDAERVAALRRLALQAELAIDSREAGADVEWLVSAGRLWLVQARPLPRLAAPRREAPPQAFDFARAEPGRRWSLDITHNPEPLSPAQAGLVERVRERLGAPLALACGYLYQGEGEGEAEAESEALGADELEALFFEDLEPSLDRRLTAAESRPADLEADLQTFLAVVGDYERITGALRAARRGAKGAPHLGHHIGAGLCAALAADSRFSAAARRRAALLAESGEASFFAPHAPIWDVAAPSYGERPARLAELVRTIERRRGPASAAAGGAGDRLGDLVHAVGEIDDRLYYRAQRLVRRALLARSEVLGMAPQDIFWCPLERVCAARPGTGAELAALADENRRRHEERRQMDMPLEVRGATRRYAPRAADRVAFRGAGSGGRARGRAVRRCPGPGDILCAYDLTPGEAVDAAAAAAIALEGGALLGHAAAMARELEIPIVVGAAGLRARVEEGEPLWLDGDAGLVVKLGEPG